jgi:hypothetical protein
MPSRHHAPARRRHPRATLLALASLGAAAACSVDSGVTTTATSAGGNGGQSPQGGNGGQGGNPNGGNGGQGGNGGDNCIDNPNLCQGDTPACAPDGSCVQCTPQQPDACTDNTPVCNPSSLSCTPCAFHAQCPASACNIFSGACIDASPISVGPGETFTDLTAAINSINTGSESEAVILLKQGDYDGPFNTNVTGKIIAILAQNGRPNLSVPTVSTSPTLTVNNNTTVLLQGINLTLNGSSLGIDAKGNLALDDVEVRQNDGGGIDAGSTADIRVRNTFIASNGNADGISLGGGSLELLYSSVHAGSLSTTNVEAINCDDGNNITIRNSILFSEGMAATVNNCTNATISFTASDTTSALPGNDNSIFDLTNPGGYFANLGQGNLRLEGPNKDQFQNLAQWLDGDPPGDIDGNPRPSTDMAPDTPGAHLGSN